MSQVVFIATLNVAEGREADFERLQTELSEISHAEEDGLSHQFELPDVPPPEDLESDESFFARMEKKKPGMTHIPRVTSIERRPVKRRDYLDPQPTEPVQHIWFRVKGDLGDDPCRHQTVLAFMSDFALLGAALLPHPYTGASRDLQAASLDHGLWFHRRFRQASAEKGAGPHRQSHP